MAEQKFKAPKGVETGDLKLTTGSGDDVGIEFTTTASDPTSTTSRLYAKSGGSPGLYFEGNKLQTGASSTSFIGLTDTPNSFGTAGQLVAVNSSTNAVEFVDDQAFINAIIFG